MRLEEQQHPHVEFEAFCRQLAAEVQTSCGDVLPSQYAGDIARGVAAYLAETGVSSFSSDYLALLIGRALRGSGDESAARHLADLKLSDGQPPEVVDQLLLFEEVSPVVWNLFTSGLVRPTKWASGGGHTVWALDLGKLDVESGECLEMSLHLVVRAVLSVVAQVWDATGGEGLLGLKGFRGVGREGERAAKEMSKFCAGVLAKIRGERGWRAVPGVVILEAPRPKSNH